MEKIYKLKHLPTGLYYKPNVGLSKTGKVYQGKSNALTYFIGNTVTITIDVNKKQFVNFKNYFNVYKYMDGHRKNTYLIPKHDFKIEEL